MARESKPVRKWQNTIFPQTIYIGSVYMRSWERAYLVKLKRPTVSCKLKGHFWWGTRTERRSATPNKNYLLPPNYSVFMCFNVKSIDFHEKFKKKSHTACNTSMGNGMSLNCYIRLAKNVWDMDLNIEAGVKTETRGKYFSHL